MKAVTQGKTLDDHTEKLIAEFDALAEQERKEMDTIDDAKANLERIQAGKKSVMDNLRRALENADEFNLEKHYFQALDTRDKFDLSNDYAPTLAEVRQWFTPERQESVKKLEDPILILRRKNETFEQMVKAINDKEIKCPGVTVDLWIIIKSVFKPSKTIEDDGWEIYIVDGAQTMKDAPQYGDEKQTLKDKIATVQAYRELNGLSGLDRTKSILIYIYALAQRHRTN